jgi:hypothetical protein
MSPSCRHRLVIDRDLFLEARQVADPQVHAIPMGDGRLRPIAQHLPELWFAQVGAGGEKIAQRFGIASLPWHFRGCVVLCAPILRQDAAKGGMSRISARFLRNHSLEEESF